MVSSSGLPLVCVVMPMYNRDRYLAVAMESVLIKRFTLLEMTAKSDRTHAAWLSALRFVWRKL
ncbi:MAG: hypothetical protein RMX65_016415 [Nostoc sp. DedQUE01]|nr:hypothetical protein [Nostoc sp. SerVER01]MDZ8025410.1 hypothetical protein [Nostoc sp. DedQUE11]MDZ8075171.1 hypothetical protein [Nostoc sp. DedQUE01]